MEKEGERKSRLCRVVSSLDLCLLIRIIEEMNDRQRQLLGIVVEEYVKSAEPISSGFLAAAYSLGVSPATIRNDLAVLLDQGYLKKNYFSSGNVPTNQAYRFFVNEMFDDSYEKKTRSEQHIPHFRSIDEIARFMSDRSRLLSVVMNEDMDMAVDGINYLFAQPDFSSLEMMHDLACFVDALMDMRQELFTVLADEDETIFIGEENPLFSREHDLSWLVSSCDSFHNKRLAMFLVGPTRMPYERNATLLYGIRKYLSK
ncbi:MAG: Transcriptional regulator of heat shock protein [Parcubacteria group bacterium GW2011_GWB1_46_8]|nr:MAG: Transcriptional regulator of heat shock protein [Parcubacteria group bacterium GW2011_GWA1_45_7]KKU10449.1 MAG: Transcriptional regulator of heat shock protein [Parcubacteria group bacterium GW2011_GWF1_45_5]KKU43230.1 MAG: Transcriptional regulator of heat shock protein [Parcubacteria group bacterium GW2011_GWA2_46_7]KKU45936.1 MAG: Transcriptional regulator of heat shock protein [Parcubacteria group bacterium GW2011_GWB1_46_8]KKU46899.1 MAG: Transcriptional regulator of heat shock pro